jgi:hypothetical protein
MPTNHASKHATAPDFPEVSYRTFDSVPGQWQMFTMGKLSGRGNKILHWAELVEFQSISDAARRVLELEGDPVGVLFFRVYVDSPGEKSDTELLCRLEYQSEKGFYLLQRAVQWFS